MPPRDTNPLTHRAGWRLTRRNAWTLALLGAWTALLVALNVRWVEDHILKLPPPWDPAHYQTIALRVMGAFSRAGWGGAWHEVHALTPTSPPFFPLSTIPLFALFGESRAVAHLTSSLYLGLHLLGAFWLGRRLDGDRGGLLAAFLLSTFSAIINLSRDYHYDFPAAAFVTVAVCCLLASDSLTRVLPATGFGLFAGLAALTKSMAPPFLVGPFLYAVFAGHRRDRNPRPGAVACALLMATLVALPWWGLHFSSAVYYLWFFGMGKGAAPYAEAGLDPLSLRFVGYYALALINKGASLPHAVLAAAVAAGTLRRRSAGGDRDPTRAMLWSWMLSGYLVLTVSINKSGDRYVVFLLPPVAALLAWAILRLERPACRRIAVAGAAFASAINYAAWTWTGAKAAPPVTVYNPPLTVVAERPQRQWLRVASVPEGEWPLSVAVRRLGRLAPALKARSRDLYLLRHDPGADPRGLVRSAYMGLLAREPDPVSVAAYLARVHAGESPRAVLAEIARSEEFEERRARVIVIPNHVFVNAATLNYYADTLRGHLDFVPLEQVAPGSVAEAVVTVSRVGGAIDNREWQFLLPGFEHELTLLCAPGFNLQVFVLRPVPESDPLRDRNRP